MRARDGALLAVIGVVAVPCIALMVEFASVPPLPMHPATARVVAIAPSDSKYHAGRDTIVVRNANGTGQFTMGDVDVHCAVGDLVPVTQQGITLGRVAKTCH